MFPIVVILSVALLTAIDQITKFAVISRVMGKAPVDFLFGLFRIRYVENTGVAFSLFHSHPQVLTVLTALLVAFCLVLVLSRKVKPLFVNICLTVIVSGGLGNVIDRIARGYVVDFIEAMFVNFAVFNFADCCITVGAFALLGYEIYSTIKDGRQEKKSDE